MNHFSSSFHHQWQLSCLNWLMLMSAVFICNISHAQDAGASQEQTCCGPITKSATHTLHLLDNMDVEHLWLAHQHINWETGVADRNVDYEGSGKSTHCSAFAAAVGQRLGIYLLRPPEHSQILLANAQTRWLAGDAAVGQGWTKLDGTISAQSHANWGDLVLILYQNPNPKKPGHIAIVRPSLKTQQELEEKGPDVAQAGTQNHSNWDAKHAFLGHAGAWPNGVQYFSHTINP